MRLLALASWVSVLPVYQSNWGTQWHSTWTFGNRCRTIHFWTHYLSVTLSVNRINLLVAMFSHQIHAEKLISNLQTNLAFALCIQKLGKKTTTNGHPRGRGYQSSSVCKHIFINSWYRFISSDERWKNQISCRLHLGINWCLHSIKLCQFRNGRTATLQMV